MGEKNLMVWDGFRFWTEKVGWHGLVWFWLKSLVPHLFLFAFTLSLSARTLYILRTPARTHLLCLAFTSHLLFLSALSLCAPLPRTLFPARFTLLLFF